MDGRYLGVVGGGGWLLGASHESGAVSGDLGQWVFSLAHVLCPELTLLWR